MSLLSRAWLAYFQGRIVVSRGRTSQYFLTVAGVGLGRRASSNRHPFAPRPIGPEQLAQDSTPWVVENIASSLQIIWN